MWVIKGRPPVILRMYHYATTNKTWQYAQHEKELAISLHAKRKDKKQIKF